MDHRHTILMIEDDPEAVERFRAFIAPREDMEVVGTADTAEEGFALTEKLLPDTVILDWELRDDSHGSHFLKSLNARDLSRRPRIMVVTRVDTRATDEYIHTFGVDRVFHKNSEKYKALGPALVIDQLQDMLGCCRCVHAAEERPAPQGADELDEEALREEELDMIREDFCAIWPSKGGDCMETLVMAVHMVAKRTASTLKLERDLYPGLRACFEIDNDKCYKRISYGLENLWNGMNREKELAAKYKIGHGKPGTGMPELREFLIDLASYYRKAWKSRSV